MKKQITSAKEARFEPLGDHVLVKPAPAKTMDSMGLLIPENYRKNPPFGEVIAVGPGRDQHEANEVMIVKKGDTVMYGEYSGTPINIDGVDYMLFRQADFLGKLLAKDVEVKIAAWGGKLNPEGHVDPSIGIHENYNPEEAGTVTALESEIGADINVSAPVNTIVKAK